MPRFTPIAHRRQSDFRYRQPCTPPQFFHADHDNPRQTDGAGDPLDSQWYDPTLDLKAHYLDRAVDPPPEPFGDDPCRTNPGTARSGDRPGLAATPGGRSGPMSDQLPEPPEPKHRSFRRTRKSSNEGTTAGSGRRRPPEVVDPEPDPG